MYFENIHKISYIILYYIYFISFQQTANLFYFMFCCFGRIVFCCCCCLVLLYVDNLQHLYVCAKKTMKINSGPGGMIEEVGGDFVLSGKNNL